MSDRTYIAIDLKSFYASVECVDRGLDPLKAHLVVADPTRTDKTICLAVTPALKAYGIGGRARLFEVNRRVKEVIRERRRTDPGFRLDFIIAPPQMARYMEVSSRIYGIYLKYVAPEDVHVYSVDEVFIDATEYLKLYKCTAHELVMRMIRDTLETTGITATAGIGSNLYLAKVAMDIVAKHIEPDADGVRVAQLDERSYRERLWDHVPLTDFWRVGRGTAARLEQAGIRTMGQLARVSLDPAWETYLYKVFGVGAELLIDHAWGWEPCTMQAIKAYRPSVHSISSGQVLKEPYDCTKTRVIVREMIDALVLDLVSKRLVTDQIVLDLGYDRKSMEGWNGTAVRDWYGRTVPKPAHGSVNLDGHTNSDEAISSATMQLFDRIMNAKLFVRRVNIAANNVLPEDQAPAREASLFDEPVSDPGRERRRQEAILDIKRRFGKNAILKGVDFEEGATAIERNAQIGGHKA